MGDSSRTVQFRVDSYTRVCLTVIAVLLTVLIVGLWADGARLERAAMGAGPYAAPPKTGGIPDSGLQREELLRETQQVTAKLDRLVRLFESGQAKVQVTETGKDGAAKDAPAAPAAKDAEKERVFIKRTD